MIQFNQQGTDEAAACSLYDGQQAKWHNLCRCNVESGWYHIMNRGAGRRTIFPNNELKESFLDLLSEIHAEYTVEIHAYCLMSNHYH